MSQKDLGKCMYKTSMLKKRPRKSATANMFRPRISQESNPLQTNPLLMQHKVQSNLYIATWRQSFCVASKNLNATKNAESILSTNVESL
jgi:hypothetical protein